jgi:tetratricopeptide (TPR) repeat protein
MHAILLCVLACNISPHYITHHLLSSIFYLHPHPPTQAIDIAHHTEQSDNIYAAYAEGILAEINYKQGNFKDAADRFRHALASYEDHYKSKSGPQNIKSLGAAQLLSFAFMTGRRYDKAAEALKVELRNVYEVYGSESREAAYTMVNLASACLYTDNFEDAEHYYTKALTLYEAYEKGRSEGSEGKEGNEGNEGSEVNEGKEGNEGLHVELPMSGYVLDDKPFQLIFTGLGDINFLRGRELTAMNYYLRLEELLGKEQAQQQQELQQQQQQLELEQGQMNEQAENKQELKLQMQEQERYPRKTYRAALKNLGLIKWRLGDYEVMLMPKFHIISPYDI